MLCALRRTSAHGISFKWYSSVIGWVTSSKTFIQTAVRLDVQVFSASVSDVEQLLRVAVYRAAVINLQLNAEMPQALAMKHEVGRVVVFMDNVVSARPSRTSSRRCRRYPNRHGRG